MPTSSSHWGRRTSPWPITAQAYTRTLTEAIGLSDLATPLVNTVNPGTELTPTVPATGTPTQNGAALQQALTNAAIGDLIVLKSGGTYETASANGFTFPPKGTGWDNRRVTVCCSRLADLGAGTRVSPSQTNNFAKLVTGVKGPTLNFAGSRGWTLQGLEVSYTAACQAGASVQQIVDFTNAAADLTLDRCWVHPRESVTAPTSVYRAAHNGLAGGWSGLKNFRLQDSYVDGFTGWGYDNQENHMGALYSQGGSHLRVKNNFIQGFRGWYLERYDTASDVVIQGNRFDCPPLWQTWQNPVTSAFLQLDHRHLILYAALDMLIVGNHFTGATRYGPLGIFYDQGVAGTVFKRVRYLSNFLEGPDLLAHLAEIVIHATPYAGSDLSFVNNLLARGWTGDATWLNRWSNEFGGPAGNIGPGQPISAGHGINVLHNTMRNVYNKMFSYDQVNKSEFCDIRYNIAPTPFYWLDDGVGFPNLLLTRNRFIGVQPPPAYVDPTQIFATDAAAGLGNAAAGDAGGPITNYALTSGQAGADVGSDHGCDIPALQAALAGTSVDYDYPELPRTTVDTTYSLPTGGTLHTPANSAAFQTALDTAVGGDVIRLTAGTTYTGTFFLRASTPGTGWIYITSSSAASLPAPGVRVAPSDAANMPKIVTATAAAAIHARDGSHHYRFVGLEITSTVASGFTPYFLVSTDGNTDAASLATMPHHMIFDRCYVHGHATNGCKKGIRLNSGTSAVIESYFSDFKEADRSDTNAIHCASSTGPITISNCHLSAATECVMFGGEDSPVAQMCPADITVINNHFFKPTTWNVNNPDGQYAGVLYAVKNHFELKNAQRVLLDGNTFENNWVQDQDMAIALTPRNQNWNNDWARVTDVTITHNVFLKNQGGGVAIQGDDNESFNNSGGAHFTQRTARILIQHNNFGTCGVHLFGLHAGPKYGRATHLVIDHNTCAFATHLIKCNAGGTGPHFIFTNNVIPHGYYGIISDDLGGSSAQVLAQEFPGCIFTNNLIIGDPATTSNYGYPAKNMAVTTPSGVGFVDYAGGNWQLATTSIGYRAGIEGRDVGMEVLGPPPPPVTYPAFPTTGLLDTTTRTNEPVLSNGGFWSPVVNMQLAGNAIATVTNTTGYAVTAPSTSSADCEVYATVAANTAPGGSLELYARYTGGGPTYRLTLSNFVAPNYTSVTLGKVVAGVSTTLAASGAVAIAPGDQIGLSVIGTTLRGYRNGTGLLTATDGANSIPAAGKLVVLLTDSTGRLTQVGGGPVVGTATVGTLTLSSTLQNISLRATYVGANFTAAIAAVQYRVTGSGTWRQAYPPFVDRRATLGGVADPYVGEARGSIVGLVKNTSYDVQVQWTDPTGPGVPTVGTVSTLSDTPPTGSGTARSITSNATMATALGAMNPGDTLTWAAGSYNPFTIARSGTAGAWIVLDGGGVATISGLGVTRNISLNANFIVLKNFIFGPSDFHGLVMADNTHHLFIQDNVFQNVSRLCLDDPKGTHYGDTGILMGLPTNNVFILRNSVTSTSLAAAVQVPPYEGPGQGIAWNTCTTAVIQGNTITGAFRDAITSDFSGAALVDVDVADNTVVQYVDNGIEVKGGNVNVRVWGNIATNDAGDNPYGCNTNTTDNQYGPIYIFRNTGRWTSTNTLGTTVYKGPSVPAFIFHNSQDASAAVPSSLDGYVIGPGVVLNNILKNRGSIIAYGVGAATTYDYNCHLITGSSSPYAYGNLNYATWAAFRTGTGQEAHGLNVDPQFADTALHLGATSPCKNAGVVIPNFNSLDSAWPYTGAAPDLGAYES